MEKTVLFVCGVFFLASCQTGELSRVRTENDSLRKELGTCRQGETDLQQREKDLMEQIRSMETELKELRQTNTDLAAEKGSLEERIQKLQEELSVLREDYRYLSRILEELRFTQGNPKDRTSGETKTDALESRSGIVKKVHPDGRKEYLDASSLSLEGQGMFLSIEEGYDGTLSLYLNIQHGYWVVRKDPSVAGIAVAKAGKTFPIPYTASDVHAAEQGGYRKELIRLPVKGKILEILKELVQGEGEIHLLIAFPDFSRDRVLSRKEVQAMGNVLYAFREMGGTF
ncbi:MAG: hypothetical protein Kow009_11270 [Spirochaetales bacterium]